MMSVSTENQSRLLKCTILIAFLLSACAKSEGELKITVDATAPPSIAGGGSAKALLSQWTESGNLYKLDLRSAKLGGAGTLSITAITGESCSCGVTIQGTEAGGTMTVSSCSGASACTSFNQTANFTKPASTLKICPASSSGCTTFN